MTIMMTTTRDQKLPVVWWWKPSLQGWKQKSTINQSRQEEEAPADNCGHGQHGGGSAGSGQQEN